MSSYKVKPTKSFKWQIKNGLKFGAVLKLEEGVALDVPDEVPEHVALEMQELGLVQYVEGKGDGAKKVAAKADVELDDDLDSELDEAPKPEAKPKAKPKAKRAAKPKAE